MLMTNEVEYHDAMVKMLEFIWGKGYMAPGGPRNVAILLEGTEPEGKRILDIGCGIGGPAMDMVRQHGAEVVGIDLEAPLIDRANEAARQAELDDRCTFKTVTLGPLPFADASFDIVVSSGAITQSDGKDAIFDDCYRVLKPGGYLSCYEWMKSERDYSDDMRYWFKMEGLTYALETLEQYGKRLRASGFEDVELTEASEWYRAEARREYELIKGDLYEKLVELLGQKDADHFVENWRAMVVVCDSGEMRQGYCRGRKAQA
jgi:ubiquinone/menaquinone biosynthesis C-methylase UbiE